VFRIAIFASFALCTVACSLLILYALKATRQSSGNSAFEFIKELKTVFRMFNWLMYLFGACAVLSVLTRYKATLLSVIVRTVLLLTVSGLLFYAKPTSTAYIKAFEILDEANANLDHMTDDKAKKIFEDNGMTKEDADALLKDLNQNDRVKAFFSGIVTASVVSFLLAMTSLHNLVKREGMLSQFRQELSGTAETMYDNGQSNSYYNDDNDDF